ncbi:MAG: DNA methyltransferase, partial [Verrucomicrobia bacterium]|nr:DNA methyltransferase [Verrucomicrobiota bacterium]
GGTPVPLSDRRSQTAATGAAPAGKPSALLDTRVIYCGDNLEQLRKLPDACVDLIYIDPPFNSNRNYEVFWGETKEKRAFEDRHESTKAYIEYMRPRCVELARVLKKSGSFYYHCDWHASHYVKVMLDQIFGENNFRSEIIWRRTNAKGLAFKGHPNNHDTIFYYVGSDVFTWNRPFSEYDPDYIAKFYRFVEEGTGRRFRLSDLTNPNPDRPNLTYEWKGHKRVWRWTKERMEEADKKGIIHYSSTGLAAQKRYLDEMQGQPVDTVWDDIPPIQAQADERLGYPTQKPLALLDRIIKASSDENQIVLDAFCGCGTALVAAQKSKRQWIGIDISPTACRVMAKRLKDKRVCGMPEDEELWAIGRGFIVRDLPWTEEKLRAIPPFEFENWAVIALGGRKNKAQVGDKGIDGRIFPVTALDNVREAGADELPLEERFYAMQVKQKDKTGRPDIDSFETAMRRAKCEKGFFVSFDYSSDALQEIGRFFREEHRIIIPLTVREILDEEIARKLA